MAYQIGIHLPKSLVQFGAFGSNKKQPRRVERPFYLFQGLSQWGATGAYAPERLSGVPRGPLACVVGWLKIATRAGEPRTRKSGVQMVALAASGAQTVESMILTVNRTS